MTEMTRSKHQELGLTDDEYERICSLIDREPTGEGRIERSVPHPAVQLGWRSSGTSVHLRASVLRSGQAPRRAATWPAARPW